MTGIPSVQFLGIDIVSFLVFLGIIFCVFLAISLTLNLEFGLTGIPNFGKAMFVSVGGAVGGSFAYRLTEILLRINTHGDDIYFNPVIISQITPILQSNILFAAGIFMATVAVAAGVGALVGFLASYPAIKLREDYLGMLLLAAGEFWIIFQTAYSPLIGGTQGMLLPNTLAATESVQGLHDVFFLGIAAVFALLVFIYAEKVAKSPLGRTLRAIRDNEFASEALGKDNVAIRRRVLIIASAISAVTGALFTMYQSYIDPLQYGRELYTFWPWVMVIMGGAGNNYGVVLGAIVFALIYNVTFQTGTSISGTVIQQYIPISITRLEPIIVGTLLILVLLFRPQGIIPEKATKTLSRERLQWIVESVVGRKKQAE